MKKKNFKGFCLFTIIIACHVCLLICLQFSYPVCIECFFWLAEYIKPHCTSIYHWPEGGRRMILCNVDLKYLRLFGSDHFVIRWVRCQADKGYNEWTKYSLTFCYITFRLKQHAGEDDQKHRHLPLKYPFARNRPYILLRYRITWATTTVSACKLEILVVWVSMKVYAGAPRATDFKPAIFKPKRLPLCFSCLKSKFP